MCGVFAHAGKQEVNTRACLDALAHRGPDHRGLARRGAVTLGHLRLSIIDVSEKGNQPMVSASGRSAIVFNGEIYNYKELKETLAREGAVFVTGSDTEVILEGYERYGMAFFERLRGMWAFVLHDTERREVIGTRDPFGIKPLYYAMHGGEAYFASEMRCLKAAGIPFIPNAAGYATFYNLGYFIAPATSCKGVFKALPGEVLVWDTEKKELRQERRISRFAARPAFEGGTYEAAVDALDHAFTDSIAAHYVADVPVSMLLSGGNDSSLIAALSRKLGKRPTAYHVAVRGSEDTPYAKRVAETLDLPLVVEELTDEALAAQYEKVWDVLDEPTGDTSIIPTSLIYARIKGQAKVVLSGDGGDELFGGYGRHRTLMRHAAVRRSHPLDSLARAALAGQSQPPSLIGIAARRLHTLLIGRGLMDDLIGAYLKSTRIIGRMFDNAAIRDELYALYAREQDPRIPPSLFFDMLAYLPDDLLYKTDTASMAASIEARVPLVDSFLYGDIASVMPALDTRTALDDKQLLKEVLLRYLPRDVVYRSKKGFGVPMMAYDARAFVTDFHAACAFHLQHAEAFGVGDDMRALIDTASLREGVARAYPRFAFALISNWKLRG